MSVVRSGAWRRWALVVAGTVLLVATPSLVTFAASTSARVGAPGARPAALLARVLASGSVAHAGLAQSRGALGLPDVRQFGDIAALLGGTTRARVWWQDADHWRVARLTATGEQDLYASGGDGVVTWDYEENVRRTTVGVEGLRLPRTDDLLPPQAARRLLGHLGMDDALTALAARRIAGHDADGFSVRPGSERSTIGTVDVWVDRASGLPLTLAVHDRRGAVAFETTFLDVDIARPASADLAVPLPPGARLEVADAPDLVAVIDRYAPRDLPSTLAAEPRTPGLVRGTSTYGRGLARFVVVPLPSGPADDVLEAAKVRAPVEQVPGGRLVVLDSDVVTAAIAVGDLDDRAFLVAGLVTTDVVRAAGRSLLARGQAGTS